MILEVCRGATSLLKFLQRRGRILVLWPYITTTSHAERAFFGCFKHYMAGIEVLEWNFGVDGKVLGNKLFYYICLPPVEIPAHRFGWWRSPVAHLHGVQGVASSNLVVPTYKKPAAKAAGFVLFGSA